MRLRLLKLLLLSSILVMLFQVELKLYLQIP